MKQHSVMSRSKKVSCIGGYDAETKRFHNRFFSNNGPYDPAGNEYVGGVAGGKLTFVLPNRVVMLRGRELRAGNDLHRDGARR